MLCITLCRAKLVRLIVPVRPIGRGHLPGTVQPSTTKMLIRNPDKTAQATWSTLYPTVSSLEGDLELPG